MCFSAGDEVEPSPERLADEVAFRRNEMVGDGRGIARQLLRHLLADARAHGCRSVVIGADVDDTPIQLYRRLGFTDEVYRHRCYRLANE